MKQLLKAIIFVLIISSLAFIGIMYRDVHRNARINNENVNLIYNEKVKNGLYIIGNITYNKNRELYDFDLEINNKGTTYNLGSGEAYPQGDGYYDKARLVEKIKKPDYIIYNLVQPVILNSKELNVINIINPVVILKNGMVLGNMPVGSEFYGVGDERAKYKNIKLDIANYVIGSYISKDSIYKSIGNSLNLKFLDESEGYIKEFASK